MRPWLLAALITLVPACEGIEDIPDSTVICCLNDGRYFLIMRLDCVYDPAGRVVEYRYCDDAGAPTTD